MALIFTSELKMAQYAGMEIKQLILLVGVLGRLGRLNSLTSLLMEEICMLELTLEFASMYYLQ